MIDTHEAFFFILLHTYIYMKRALIHCIFCYNATKDANFALGAVHRAEFMVKAIAILQNPQKIFEIINAENFKNGLSDHYGTEVR